MVWLLEAVLFDVTDASHTDAAVAAVRALLSSVNNSGGLLLLIGLQRQKGGFCSIREALSAPQS